MIRGLSDLIRATVVVVSEYQDRGLAAAGTENRPSFLPLAEELTLNHVAARSVLVGLGNRAVAALQDGSHAGGQFRIVLDSQLPHSLVRISRMRTHRTEQRQQ